MPAARASSRKSSALRCSAASASGSARIWRNAASAAAAFAGVMPALKMKPGVVYLRYWISSRLPATYPPQLASDFDSVPDHSSTSARSTPKCSPMPPPVGAEHAEAVRLVDHQQRAMALLDRDERRQVGDVAVLAVDALDDDQHPAVLMARRR